jgi:hypothetical protein
MATAVHKLNTRNRKLALSFCGCNRDRPGSCGADLFRFPRLIPAQPAVAACMEG